jgi:5-methylcytosine-specific restriction endonuclease McrA
MTITMLRDEHLDDPNMMRFGVHGFAFQVKAMMYANKHLTDGVLERHMLPVIASLAFIDTKKRRDDLVSGFVECGIWHQHGDNCTDEKCPVSVNPVPKDCYTIHRFWDGQEKSAVVKERRAKNTRKKDLLGDEFLVAQIIARDGYNCRFCGRRVRKTPLKDTRSKDKLHLEHLDPDGPNTFENVVVACVDCNTAKGKRTVEEAGMTLLPSRHLARLNATAAAPDHTTDHAPDQTTDQTTDQESGLVGDLENTRSPRPGPDHGPEQTTHAAASRERDARDSGRGLVGGLVSGPDRAGPGLVSGLVSGQDSTGQRAGPLDAGDPFVGVSVLDQRLQQDGLLADGRNPQ